MFPGLNCYSCPGAIAACPLGTLQNALSSAPSRFPFYILGFLILAGLFLGRLICGFLCPFGLIQELLYKIPLPKLKKNKITHILSYTKYMILIIFVIYIPLFSPFKSGFPLPSFCKYICPAGTLEGGLILVLGNPAMRSMAGVLFSWKVFVISGGFSKYLLHLPYVLPVFMSPGRYLFPVCQDFCFRDPGGRKQMYPLPAVRPPLSYGYKKGWR